MNNIVFERVLSVCSKDSMVREEVIKNHDENRWWPTEVQDYRLRLIIPGLSSRVSYRAIETYSSVVYKLVKKGYEFLKDASDEEVLEIVRPLGLFRARLKFIRSMIYFIETTDFDLRSISPDKLIPIFAENIEGASYKVAQCTALYLNGYHSGVIPVDSGMVKYLGRCIGFEYPKSAIGHNILRKELEQLAKEIDVRKMQRKNGYEGQVDMSSKSCVNWWIHLVLIYYKRAYCNKRNPKVCPLWNEGLAIGVCSKDR